MKKYKIVWLCSFSDNKLREHLKIDRLHWGNLLRKFLSVNSNVDFAVWNSNAIDEIEKFDSEFEFHIVAPHKGVNGLQEFSYNGIYYHIYWSEWDILSERIKRTINLMSLKSFRRHRSIVKKLITQIQPDLVHIIGIENKFYSMCAFDIPFEIPIISQLQTLVNDERFKDNCGRKQKEYEFDAWIEREIIKKSNFIGTIDQSYIKIIRDKICQNVRFLPIDLALTESLSLSENVTKKWDFVYFAANISKACDWAIEAFALAYKKHPEITLDVVGGFSSNYKDSLDNRISELGIADAITFEGMLPTHEDVLHHIKQSKFAVLPLKIDLISGTIREAMASGIPVVSTITPETPLLNIGAQTILLSQPGNFEEMAQNMVKLVEDESFALMIKENALKVASERKSNAEIITEWLNSYRQCLSFK
ncbi:MAG: glycosyltransferase [Bacteroidales bacterium]|nr:glycosyltransferase [Bacteroidales bacterium]